MFSAIRMGSWFVILGKWTCVLERRGLLSASDPVPCLHEGLPAAPGANCVTAA